MMIYKPEFLAKPDRPALTDEEIAMRVNSAVEEAKRAGKARDIYVDLSIGARADDPTAARALAICATAGWRASIDGRSGFLILNP